MLVAAADGVAAYLNVPVMQLADRHLLNRRQFFGKVQLHGRSPSCRRRNPRVSRDTLRLVSTGTSRPIPGPFLGPETGMRWPDLTCFRQRTTPRARIDATSR